MLSPAPFLAAALPLVCLTHMHWVLWASLLVPWSSMRNHDDENEEAFLRLILRYPLAASLMLKYCQHNDLPMLKRIHRSFGRWVNGCGSLACSLTEDSCMC